MGHAGGVFRGAARMSSPPPSVPSCSLRSSASRSSASLRPLRG